MLELTTIYATKIQAQCMQLKQSGANTARKFERAPGLILESWAK